MIAQCAKDGYLFNLPVLEDGQVITADLRYVAQTIQGYSVVSYSPDWNGSNRLALVPKGTRAKCITSENHDFREWVVVHPQRQGRN